MECYIETFIDVTTVVSTYESMWIPYLCLVFELKNRKSTSEEKLLWHFMINKRAAMFVFQKADDEIGMCLRKLKSHSHGMIAESECKI